MKFRVDREVLADAVTWVARGLPARPPVPVLAGVLIEADDEGTPHPLGLRLRGLRQGHRRRPTSPRRGTVLVLGPAARRHLAQPAGQAGRRRHRGQQGPGHLWLVPVQPAADAGRRLPDPADRRPTASGTIAGDVFTQAVAQVADRGRPRRHPADPHRRPGRDRGRQDHPARHRPLPAGDARADLEPRRPPTPATSR